jgi:predicted ATPase
MEGHKKEYYSARSLQDPAVMSASYCSWTEWKLGHPDQALTTATGAITLAEELEHPFSRSAAYSFAAGLHLFRGETLLARDRADVAIDICARHEFVVWLAFASVVRGRVRVEEGEIERGLEEMRGGIASWEATGAVVTLAYCLAQLAEGLALAGQPGEAQDELRRAQTIVDRTGERYYEAELYRLAGELALQEEGPSGQQAAEKNFRRSIDIARRQGVGSLELRAAMSLTRMQGLHGEAEDGVEVLRSCYAGFDEGFDTRDLRQAKALLERFS